MAAQPTVPTTVNPQVTDEVTATTMQVLGNAPSVAMGVVYQYLAQAVGLALTNATNSQQALQAVANTATNKIVSDISGKASS